MPGGGSRGDTERRYRTKIELLRDLVQAARQEHRKTRIIGLANLNRTSFDRYAALGVSMGLLEPRGKSFSTTSRAVEWLGAVNAVLGKSTEVSAALRTLARLAAGTRSNGASGNGGARDMTTQMIARLAWTDLVLSERSIPTGRSGGTTPDPRASSAPPLVVPSGRPRAPNELRGRLGSHPRRER